MIELGQSQNHKDVLQSQSWIPYPLNWTCWGDSALHNIASTMTLSSLPAGLKLLDLRIRTTGANSQKNTPVHFVFRISDIQWFTQNICWHIPGNKSARFGAPLFCAEQVRQFSKSLAMSAQWAEMGVAPGL